MCVYVCVCVCFQALQERRDRCEEVDTDLIVWTNQRLKNWAKHVDLQVSRTQQVDVNVF